MTLKNYLYMERFLKSSSIYGNNHIILLKRYVLHFEIYSRERRLKYIIRWKESAGLCRVYNWYIRFIPLTLNFLLFSFFMSFSLSPSFFAPLLLVNMICLSRHMGTIYVHSWSHFHWIFVILVGHHDWISFPLIEKKGIYIERGS